MSVYIGEQIQQNYQSYQNCKDNIKKLNNQLEAWKNKNDNDIKLQIEKYVNATCTYNEEKLSLHEFVNTLLKEGKIRNLTGNTFKSNFIPPRTLEGIEGGTLDLPISPPQPIDIDLLKYSEKYRESENKENTIKDYIEYKKNNIQEEIEGEEKKIESFGAPLFKEVSRISAHRQLTLKTDLSTVRTNQAKSQLRNSNSTNWQKSITEIQNDFDQLVQDLYAEEAVVTSKFTQKKRLSPESNETAPRSILSNLVNFWNDIFPHRKITLSGLQLEVKSPNNESSYKPSEMSDGERNIFYILGKCLLAPDESLLIIDEPESHINVSISNKFWNYIQEKRHDCCFLFITHDIGFINTNRNSQKYFIKEYQHGNKWDIKAIDKDILGKDILEEVKLIVLGSRKDVIFVEGKYESLDFEICSRIYNDYLIIPVGTCEQVKRQVKAINENQKLHHNSAYGIIDSDSLSNKEKKANQSSEIYPLPVAIIENIFLLEDVIGTLCSEKNTPLPEDYTSKIIAFVKEHREGDLKKKTKHRLRNVIQQHINESNIDKIELGKFRATECYKGFESSLNGLIEKNDLNGILFFFQNKGLYKKILSEVLNCKDVDHEIKSLLGKKKVLDCIREYLPKIK